MKNITIIGKVDGQIYTRQYDSGAIGGRVPILVRESWKNEDGSENVREYPFKVTVWNNTALFCANRFKDGDSIFVDGDLNMVSFNKTSDGAFDATLMIAARKVLPIANCDETYINFRGIGNLTADPEMRYTNDVGAPVTNARMAFNRRYTDSDGERQEETLFTDLTAWNNLAETLDQYTHKGSRLYVEANRVELEFYKGRENGDDRVKTKINATYTQFLTPAGGISPDAPGGSPVPDSADGQAQDEQPW